MTKPQAPMSTIRTANPTGLSARVNSRPLRFDCSPAGTSSMSSCGHGRKGSPLVCEGIIRFCRVEEPQKMLRNRATDPAKSCLQITTIIRKQRRTASMARDGSRQERKRQLSLCPWSYSATPPPRGSSRLQACGCLPQPPHSLRCVPKRVNARLLHRSLQRTRGPVPFHSWRYPACADEVAFEEPPEKPAHPSAALKMLGLLWQQPAWAGGPHLRRLRQGHRPHGVGKAPQREVKRTCRWCS